MNFASDPIETMGLRHVIEDGMQGLEPSRGDLNEERIRFALERLNDIISRAIRGAELTSPSWSHAKSGDMIALEVYSRMFEFFSETYKDDLPKRLKDVSSLLETRLSGRHSNKEDFSSAKGFLQEFLEKIEREEVYKKQSEPSFLKLGNICR